MRTARRLIAAPIALILLLGACSTSGSTTDTVSQPDFDPNTDANDPGVSDQVTVDAMNECLSGVKVEGRPLRIVTTVAPITNLVAAIAGGSGAEVQGVVPEGTNSHTFEPPPSAAKILEQADIVFMNGMSLEEPTLALAEANAKDAVICQLGTATLQPSLWLYDFSFPKEGGKPNPHLWTNPLSVMPYLTAIRDALLIADPTHGDIFDKNYVALSKMATDLDEAMLTATATVPLRNRKLLTYHDAYAYFSKRYEYEVIGAVQPQSFEEPSPKEVADLIEQVKVSGVPAIFGSEVFPSAVLEQIGKETGVRYVDVLRDDDLLGKPGDADHSWWALMRFNFVTMVEALGGDAAALTALSYDTSLGDDASYPQ